MARPDVIAAIATPPGRGGIGVVRISGPDLGLLAAGILGRLPPPRHAALAGFRDGTGGVIDRGIALYFPAPASYTGEDVLELQGHGGRAVMQSLLARCLDLGARLAQPGEFTRRAFLNEKLDLAQAESVADLIDADTREAARCAMRSLSGDFSREIHALVDGLIELRSLVEATLDFPDEEIDFLEAADAGGRLERLRDRLEAMLAAARQGSLLREGLHVVLAGQPNVGKSSLLNRLAGEEVAIVTEVPGTTRDAIHQHVEVSGIPIHVIDTAGLRETQDPVERIGIERTRAAIDRADLVLLIVDAQSGETTADADILASLPPGLPRITVLNKIDLTGETPSMEEARDGEVRVALSARSGEGLDLLRDEVLRVAGWHPGGEGVFMARERHLQALREAQDRLEGAALDWDRLELMAEELGLAQRALSEITGEFTPDDLLGEIFGRFCIGK